MSFKSKEVNSHTTLAYRKPPIPGNIINGLGEKEWRQASHVFHEVYPWSEKGRGPWLSEQLLPKN